MSAQKLNGAYRLTGIQDMAAGFQFTPDGKFDFFYIYGVADRNASGTYTIDGDTVHLKSDKPPGKDFKIDVEKTQGTKTIIKVKAPNEFLLRHVYCFCNNGEKNTLFESNAEGIIEIEGTTCDKLYLRHEIFPDIPTLIRDSGNTNNYFEVSMLPSLQLVSFQGIDLFIKEDELTCYPNYFMPFENIRFIKE